MVASGASPDGQPLPWTLQRLISWGTSHFRQKGIDSPRLTIEELVGHVLSMSRLQIYMDLQRPLEAGELARLRALVEQRDARIPLQHLLGTSEFRGRSFKIDRRALIPRPETELLVEACLEGSPPSDQALALELGTGSGIIAISLLAERPALRMVAVELSAEAAALARENAARLGVTDRLDLREGDLFAPLRSNERFDLIVSNPPYVASATIATLEPEVRDHDPRLALDGGERGLDVIERIATQATKWLIPGGSLALEIGDDQGAEVKALLEGAGFEDVRIGKDYAGLDRLALGRAAATRLVAPAALPAHPAD
jgi:release factor glutamine methyltransferase